MKTIEIQVYEFDELTEDAKENARQRFRDVSQEFYEAEYVIDDAKTIGSLFGLDIKHVFYSGFYSQGDGACFEGSYEYKKGGLKEVKEYAPKDAELHEIVADLQELQRKNFYQLSAATKQYGFYSHSGCMVVDVWDNRTGGHADRETTESMTDILRLFADWIYTSLENEYEYQDSDVVIDENIRANEYDFDENGERI